MSLYPKSAIKRLEDFGGEGGFLGQHLCLLAHTHAVAPQEMDDDLI